MTSDNPRTEDPEKIIADILEGTKGRSNVVAISNRRDAIKYALSISQKGDTVLLAGKGHETYQEINGKRFPFDEREVVSELLEETGKEK